MAALPGSSAPFPFSVLPRWLFFFSKKNFSGFFGVVTDPFYSDSAFLAWGFFFLGLRSLHLPPTPYIEPVFFFPKNPVFFPKLFSKS